MQKIHLLLGEWVPTGEDKAGWESSGTACGIAVRGFLYASYDWMAVDCEACLAMKNPNTPVYMTGHKTLIKR